jgi:large subunit ribosomal protein L24
MLSRVKKDDTVLVLSGKDKGKQGVVISVDPKKDLVLVKDVGVVTRHVKARRAGEKGGRIREEGYVPLSRVMPMCPSCKKPCRVQVKFLENTNKERVCHRCKDTF